MLIWLIVDDWIQAIGLRFRRIEFQPAMADIQSLMAVTHAVNL